MNTHRWIWMTAIVISSLAFGVALHLPLLSIQPGVGRWTGVAKLLAANEFTPISITLYGGIKVLWQDNEKVLALLMALFSLVLPVIKLTVLWAEGLGVVPISRKIWQAVRWSSKYAMLEVMLIGLMILLLKKLPGDSEVRIEPGAWYFTCSVLLSLLVSGMIKTNANEASRNLNQV